MLCVQIKRFTLSKPSTGTSAGFSALRHLVSCCLMLFGFSFQVQAVDVIAKGVAPIVKGNVGLAREKALEDAIRNAALQVGASIRSTQRYEQGLLTEDDIELSTQAQVQNVRILEEEVEDHQLRITAKVQLEQSQGCSDNPKSQYQRTFAVAEVGIEHPKDLTVGQLRNASSVLGNRLTQTMNHSNKVVAFNVNEAKLYTSLGQAPRSLPNQVPLTDNIGIAKFLGTQFVVSAVVRSMGMISPQSWMGLNSDRVFDMQLFVHDGVTGSLLHKSHLRDVSSWHFNRHRQVRMGSSEFWDSDYGQMIDHLFKQATDKMIQAIQCEPYMAHVIDAQQHVIRVAAGTASGLRPGDKLTLVRKTTQFGLQLEALTELKRTYIQATIKQVQPNYSIAELDDFNDVGRYGVQRGDLVVKW